MKKCQSRWTCAFYLLTVFLFIPFKWHIEFRGRCLNQSFLVFNLESLDMEQHHSFKFNADLVYMYIFFFFWWRAYVICQILNDFCLPYLKEHDHPIQRVFYPTPLNLSLWISLPIKYGRRDTGCFPEHGFRGIPDPASAFTELHGHFAVKKQWRKSPHSLQPT